jgi:hypothetical protein
MKHQAFGRALLRRGIRRRVTATMAAPILSVAMLVGAPPTSAAAQTTITCTLAIQNPHNSSHVPGTVNVVATWACTAPVSELSIDVQLFLDGVQVGQGSNANAGSAALQANAAATCVPGQYFGTAQGSVVFPPGFVPPSGSASVQSPTVLISCT